MEIKIGDKVKSECISCNAEEIWEVVGIRMADYNDGKFRTYDLKGIKVCLSDGVRISVKDCPEAWGDFTLLDSDNKEENEKEN